MSPAVQVDSIAYNDAVGEVADKVLLEDILRARDNRPTSLSQISSISGALSLQGTLGFTFPFGPAFAAGSKTYGQSSGTPSVTAGSTPTYGVTPLNNAGFIEPLTQPINADYVRSLMQDGISREVLLLLFIKEIDFPKKSDLSPSRYINDPDDFGRFQSFKKLLEDVIAAGALLKAVDVLEPAGPEFDLHVAPSIANTAETIHDKKDPTDQKIVTTYQTRPNNVDPSGFGIITSSNDAQYRVGNAPHGGGQLFRIYTGQVEICVNANEIQGHTIPSMKLSSIDPPKFNSVASISSEYSYQSHAHNKDLPEDFFWNRKWSPIFAKYSYIKPALGENIASLNDLGMVHKVLLAFGSQPAGSGAAQPSGGASGGSRGGASSPPASGGGSSQTSTSPLPAPRLSALVSGDCQQDQIILNGFSDQKFANESKKFVHVYWRSIGETLEFLGKVLRYNKREGSIITVNRERDDSVATSREFGSNISPPNFFDLQKNSPSGNLSVSYNGDEYSIPSVKEDDPESDYTSLIVSLMSTLVNLAIQPNAPQTSTPLRLLPLQ